MCDHDWEDLSRVADSSGDYYVYSICRICGETKEEVTDMRSY